MLLDIYKKFSRKFDVETNSSIHKRMFDLLPNPQTIQTTNKTSSWLYSKVVFDSDGKYGVIRKFKG